MKPFVKWAGGKRQILSRIKPFLNDSIADINDSDHYRYMEPFVGGGAVLFDLAPKKALISDLNEDLINAYQVIQSDKYLELIEKLKEHRDKYFADKDGYYYTVREWDRDPEFKNKYNDVERAARMIFLNRTCYNGLYRVNLKGQFNTPLGRYNNPLICDEANIKEIHEYLSKNDIEIVCCSYEESLAKAKDKDVIYIDPPYDYEDDDGFTKYQLKGFTFEDFKDLKKCLDKAINKGAYVTISNNATQKVMDLFSEDPKYKIFYYSNTFSTLRTINCKGSERKSGFEVIFWGMNSNTIFPQADDMNKIINLLKAGEEVLTNNKDIMDVIGVGTDRQAAYYLSALIFFKLVNHAREFTPKALEIYQDEGTIKEYVFNYLSQEAEPFVTSFKTFKNINDINIDFIVKELKKITPNFAASTLNRRAKTVKSWIEWMIEYNHQRQKEPL